MAFDFSTVGGRPMMQGDGTAVWDFGFRPMTDEAKAVQRNVMQVAPHLYGRWDGKTSVSLWEATRKVQGFWTKGEFLPAQKQPRGTCVARGGTGAANVLQCVQIVSGMRMRFMPLSHAVLYGMARELGGIRGYSDGAIGKDAAEALAKWGMVHQEEANDRDYYSDDLAVEYGAKWVPQNLKDLGADNKVSDVAAVTDPQMAADLIMSGHTITIASSYGFTMSRDNEGVCRRQGSWMHQMHLGAIIVTPSGRKVFGCAQSWGKNVPDGPLLPGCPDYVFGIEWDDVGGMLGQRDSMAMASAQGWPSLDPIDWIV